MEYSCSATQKIIKKCIKKGQIWNGINDNEDIQILDVGVTQIWYIHYRLNGNHKDGMKIADLLDTHILKRDVEVEKI